MTEGVLSRISRVASSSLPNAALVNDADRISVGDVREVMRLLADRDGWIRPRRTREGSPCLAGMGRDLLDEYGRQPLHGQHGDEPAREVISQPVGLAPGVPRCSMWMLCSTRHEVDDEELRECADCECEGYEP